jgi:hypothetical protein
MSGVYITPANTNFTAIDEGGYQPNTITSNSIDFNASGIFPGVLVRINYGTLSVNGVWTSMVGGSIDVPVSKVEEKNNGGVITYQLTILPSALSSKYYITEWDFSYFTKRTAFTYDKNVSARNEKRYLTEVDINILLNETVPTDDTKFSILEDVDGSKYVVVKTPDPKTFPKDIKNILHFNRTYWDYLKGRYITYTTGTSGNGNLGSSPVTLVTSLEPNATVLPNMPPNTNEAQRYENVSTYGEFVNVVDPTTTGFLFRDTGENLQTVFEIKYSLAANNRQSDRIMLMTKLISTDLSMSPVLNSYSLIINNKMR